MNTLRLCFFYLYQIFLDLDDKLIRVVLFNCIFTQKVMPKILT